MDKRKRYSPTYIDNRPYAVALPTVKQWLKAAALSQKFSPNFLHWRHIYSWMQDANELLPQCRSICGKVSMAFEDLYPSNSCENKIGYRPVLVPLNPDTLRPDSSHIDGLTNGVIVKMGTLYLDGKSVPTMYPGEDYVENTPEYKPGSFIQIGDSALDTYSQINFIKCDNFLISDRNILKNVSWDILDACGLAYGNGLTNPSLFRKKPGLDKLVKDALAESKKQVSLRFSPEMEQTIAENIKKRLGSDFER